MFLHSTQHFWLLLTIGLRLEMFALIVKWTGLCSPYLQSNFHPLQCMKSGEDIYQKIHHWTIMWCHLEFSIVILLVNECSGIIGSLWIFTVHSFISEFWSWGFILLHLHHSIHMCTHTCYMCHLTYICCFWLLPTPIRGSTNGVL